MSKEIKNEEKKEKKNVWDKFMNFCHGVKVETKRVHWTEKKDLIKYSITTLLFVLFFSIFFYVIDIVFAFVKTIIG